MVITPRENNSSISMYMSYYTTMVVNKKKTAEDILAILGIGYLGLFLGQRMNEVIIAQSRRRGLPQMRESYGYVIQHLVGKNARVSRTASEPR